MIEDSIERLLIKHVTDEIHVLILQNETDKFKINIGWSLTDL